MIKLKKLQFSPLPRKIFILFLFLWLNFVMVNKTDTLSNVSKPKLLTKKIGKICFNLPKSLFIALKIKHVRKLTIIIQRQWIF
jgi:hypothetical protein